jgi:hypothetical protein
MNGAWADTSRTVKRSDRTDASLEFAFRGTGVCLLGRKSDDGGQARVFLDGKKAGGFDCFSVIPSNRVPLFRVTGLTPGRHKLRVTVPGLCQDDSKGAFVYFDGFSVVPLEEKTRVY